MPDRKCFLGVFLILLSLVGVGIAAETCPQGKSSRPHDPSLQVNPLAPNLGADGEKVKNALCEPSAALPAPWDAQQILVADNEAHGQLYVFTPTAEGMRFNTVLTMPSNNRPRDIEALVRVGDTVLVIGSHSRNNRCEARPERQRLRRLKLGAEGRLEEVAFIDNGSLWEHALKDQTTCLRTLFTDPVPVHANVVCEALIQAERTSSACFCNVLNIEGGVGVPVDQVWLGLRAPLVDEQAILLRLVKDFDTLRFDRVVLLDLNRRGIRELALSPDGLTVWGLAGPEVDVTEPFRLWRVPLADLTTHTTLNPLMDARYLPPSSEGLVVLKGRALVVVDGEADPNNDTACITPGSLYMLSLP